MAEFESCFTADCPIAMRGKKHAHVAGSQRRANMEAARRFEADAISMEHKLREELLIREGFQMPRLLPTGEWAAVRFLPHCSAVYVGINAQGIWTAAFAFDDPRVAITALNAWDGNGHPPGYVPGKGLR